MGVAGLDNASVSLSFLLKSVPGMAYRCLVGDGLTVSFVSEGASRLTGYETGDLIENRRVSFFQLIHPSDYARVEAQRSRAIADSSSFDLSYRIITAEGIERWVSEVGHVVDLLDGSQWLEGYVTDISRTIKAETALQSSTDRLKETTELLDHASDAILIFCERHLLRYWNAGAERLYGWRSEEVLGKRVEDVIFVHSSDLLPAFAEVSSCGSWRGEVRQKCKDGAFVTVDSRLTAAPGVGEDEMRVLSINTDVSRQKEAEETIQKMVFYDSLTGLPNRAFILDRLHHVVLLNARTCRFGALMFIDLDNFKTLNDTMGHDNGDRLLQMVAKRMADTLRETDTVARLSGDEFVVLLEDLGDGLSVAAQRASGAGEKLLESFVMPFRFDSLEHYTSCSIGVTVFDGLSASMDQILKQADLAMYEAKNSGRNSMRFFEPEMQKAIMERAALEQDLREGLQERRFAVYYQRQVDAHGVLTGAEALIRWNHPKRGTVSPNDFIPMSEETGLIQQIGMIAMESACRQLKAWQGSPETKHLTMAVNVSARQFRHPDFAARVIDIIRETQISAAGLKLELTESSVAGDIASTVNTMTTLKREGVSFSLDDFGTGYSSLSYLKQLPLDQLKIDQSFVRDVTIDQNDSTIAKTIVALGTSLGLSVIAEGVETVAQQELLRSHGCMAYQGFLFGAPVPIQDFRYT